MDDDEQTPDAQSPAEQAVIGGSIICFISLIIIYCIVERALDGLGMHWIELLFYGIIPIFSTFLFLYLSCWHPEISGVIRVCSLLLLSCVILAEVFFFVGFALCLGCIIYHSFIDGFHP
jgi:hypothetical protein